MKRFLLKLVDSENRNIEAYLVLLSAGVAGLIALSVYHVVVLKQAFDPSLYGQGLGCLLAGGGAAAWGEGLGRGRRGNKDESDQ